MLAVALVALVALVCTSVAANAQAAATASGVRILSPSTDQVVGHGSVSVVLRSRASLGHLHVSVDGRDVKGYFGGSGGTYRATLRVGNGLHYGADELEAYTGAGANDDRVTFVVARKVSRLLALTQLRVGGGEDPARVVVRAASGTTLRAWVNGHRDDGAFEPQDGVYVGRLGANDHLRPGPNRLDVLAYRVSGSGRSAVDDVAHRTFSLKPGRLIAGAGRDRIVNGGDFVRLDGGASGAHAGPRGVTYHWSVLGHPAGATLAAATTRRPEFSATTPGTYLVQDTVRTADGASSSDTVAVIVRADVPPIGAALDTVADDRGTITLDGTAVPNTTEDCTPGPGGNGCDRHASYAVFNRQDLSLVVSGTDLTNPDGMKRLADLAARYNAAPTYLMVVNLDGTGDLGETRRLLDTLGVTKISDNDLSAMSGGSRPVSIVGVPGSPAGSAFISKHFLGCSCSSARHLANMSGYLRLNPLSPTGDFEFVFTDQMEFDTDASTVPSQITMKVGAQTYAHSVPTDGSSGFFLVRFNSQTLALDQDFFYVTNKPDGTEVPGEAKRMADDLASATAPQNDRGELLVMLQAFGKPKGTSTGWLEAAQAIGKLGGNAQVFAQMNRGESDEPHQGRYAFTARSAMDTAAAESSQSLTGRAPDGRLHGLLGRGRDDQYEPLMADPNGTVNFDLVRIVNRPSPAGGGFPPLPPGEAAAMSFLGRDPDVMGVCDRAAPTCDVRKAYYEKYVGTNWGNILTRLGSDATKAKCAQGGSDFTAADCNAARQELELEIGRRNAVEEYFGPKGLQAPFGNAQVAALVDVAKIADQIRTAVQPPAADNATSNALNIVTFITKIGGFAGAVFPPAGAVAAGLGGAFGLAAYLTHDNGSPDLVGPQVTTAAADLGANLYSRYALASSYFTTEAKIIMSDWSKMSEVAAVVTSSPKWALGDVATSTETMRLATKQAIYEALVPVAYPVLYDLGTGVTHATNWKCVSPGIFLFDKNLFQHTGTGAELTWRMTSAPYVGQAHVLAVGARHAVGSKHDAYIPAPPASLTDLLFRDPASPQGGGIGLSKLDFYSPQHFQVFSRVLQQADRGDGYGYYTCQSLPDPPGNSG